MKLNLPKINWEKVGAYTVGGLLGGGLSAVAWHLMEKHGVNPGMIFKKKVVQGNITYYDPEKDPNVADLIGDVEEEDDPDDEFEEEDESDGINEAHVNSANGGTDDEDYIYQIDRETWYRSEEDEDYTHAEMKYWIDSQEVTDENDILIPKPWLLIGGQNYDALADPESDREMFVRNEKERTDYLVVRTDGSLDG